MESKIEWREIRTRAGQFSKKWLEDLSLEARFSERAYAQEFLLDFLNVFGLRKRESSARFEEPVQMPSGNRGFIDMVIPGLLLVEMKGPGKSLADAREQAFRYVATMNAVDRPRMVMVSDFKTIHLYDTAGQLKPEHERDLFSALVPERFALDAFAQHVELFGPLLGRRPVKYRDEDPANLEASALMAGLHDAMKAVGYAGHALEVYLVRLLYCLFAEDTEIFEPLQFTNYIVQHTSATGRDLDDRLRRLFDVLNQKTRLTTEEQVLVNFPYINGGLFEGPLPAAGFTTEMRNALLEACAFDWSRISPAIFGSLFQGVMEPDARRKAGAHYTSETNILKALNPLFLEGLEAELEAAQTEPRRLKNFLAKLASLRILDPACGCGNFLVVAYRELRALELKATDRLLKASGTGVLFDPGEYLKVCVENFYGIEYDDFPSQIARVAMWLTDHQMNQATNAHSWIGTYYARLPLQSGAHIVHGNALTTEVGKTRRNWDWGELLQEEGKAFDYIVGNPPFVGKHYQSGAQKADMALVWNGVQGAGVLDYVTCWFLKAAQYMKENPATKTAFVSTNSIVQGEQPGILWNVLADRYEIAIRFAYQTFAWKNEAKGNAAVHVVVIGFDRLTVGKRVIFENENIQKGLFRARDANTINSYLIDSKVLAIQKRTKHVSGLLQMVNGSKPTDGGSFLLTEAERDKLLDKEPQCAKFIRNYIGAEEFINAIPRFCLWLVDAEPKELSKMPLVLKRIEEVKKMRNQSVDKATQRSADWPALFQTNRQPTTDYLLIPSVSSENRAYMPIGYMPPDVIASNLVFTLSYATPYHFGVLTSRMHMAWMRYTCGRLESRYRYSNTIVYNNFPWPEATEKEKETIATAAQAVLDARAAHPGNTLAHLYGEHTMPPNLLQAHRTLDRAVERAYRATPFDTDAARVEYLFARYAEIVNAAKPQELALKTTRAKRLPKKGKSA